MLTLPTRYFINRVKLFFFNPAFDRPPPLPPIHRTILPSNASSVSPPLLLTFSSPFRKWARTKRLFSHGQKVFGDISRPAFDLLKYWAMGFERKGPLFPFLFSLLHLYFWHGFPSQKITIKLTCAYSNKVACHRFA